MPSSYPFSCYFRKWEEECLLKWNENFRVSPRTILIKYFNFAFKRDCQMALASIKLLEPTPRLTTKPNLDLAIIVKSNIFHANISKIFFCYSINLNINQSWRMMFSFSKVILLRIIIWKDKRRGRNYKNTKSHQNFEFPLRIHLIIMILIWHVSFRLTIILPQTWLMCLVIILKIL